MPDRYGSEPEYNRRREDQSWLMRAAYVLERFRVVAWALGLIAWGLIAFTGMKIVTVADKFAEVEDRLMRLDTTVRSTRSQVNSLVIFRCLDSQTSQYDLEIAQLPCPPWTIQWRENGSRSRGQTVPNGGAAPNSRLLLAPFFGISYAVPAPVTLDYNP